MMIRAQERVRTVSDFNSRQNSNRNRDNKKSYKKCSSYGGSGHLKENCLRLISYPKWYRRNRDEKYSTQCNKNYANMSVTGDKNVNTGENAGEHDDGIENTQISCLIQQDVARCLSSLNPNLANHVNLLENSGTIRTFTLLAFKVNCSD